MSWNLFGKSKKAEPPSTTTQPSKSSDPTTTILKIREALETQEKREDFLIQKIEGLTNEAKLKLSKNDKKGAMFAMKKKKMYEAEVDKIQNIKMTMETQVMNLESAAQNAATFKAMQSGTDAMKAVRKDVGIDKVDDIMDDIREEMDMAKEISQALGAEIDPLANDEDELLAELQEAMAEDSAAKLEADLIGDAGKLDLPSVPTEKMPAVENTEEDELKKLEAELAAAM